MRVSSTTYTAATFMLLIAASPRLVLSLFTGPDDYRMTVDYGRNLPLRHSLQARHVKPQMYTENPNTYSPFDGRHI